MGFDYQPVLKGELLTLSPLLREDYDALFAVASDPAIGEQHPEPDRCEEPEFRRFFRDALACGGTFESRIPEPTLALKGE
jgi:hypothetical protein